MDIAIFIILGIIVILLIATIILVASKKKSENDVTERLGRFETNITKEIGEFKLSFSKDLGEDFSKLNDKVEEKLLAINEKVNLRLDQGFEKTNKTFTSILERISKIDEAQKKIDSLSTEIISLQGVLTDKKTRGIFGEVNLNYILTSVFGEKKGIYDIQHKMSNGSIADAVIFTPEPLGTVAIDSKFPLENYERMTNKRLEEKDRAVAVKLFKADVKKHIDAIASKYIIPGYTAEEAILFLPAEAIFAEINAYHPDLIQYAYDKKVWICGPTTLMSTLSTISMVIKNMERDKYAKVIHEELNKLSYEFSKYRLRWDKLSRSIDTVSKDVKDIHITTEKITKRFASINGVEKETLSLLEEEYPEELEQ